MQRHCKWDQLEGLDGPNPIWRIPPATMKLSLERKDDEAFEHIVPLVPAAVEIFETIRNLTGNLPYVFPNAWRSHHPMSENAVRKLIITAGRERYYKRHTTHGWRSSFSTIMNEWRRQHGRADDREVINLMLAHVVEDKVEGAYNRAAHMDRRWQLAQIWADMLLVDLSPPASLLGDRRK